MENFNEFLSFVRDAVWSFDIAAQKFRYINKTFADLYGISLEEIENHPFSWRKLIHPDDYYHVRAETEKVYEGNYAEIEFRIIVNGKVKWVCDKMSPVFDEEKRVRMIAGITSDITDKKLAQLRLLDSEYTFRYLFVNNPNPLWIYDLDTLQFLAVNHAAVEKYGYSESEFLSMTIADIRPIEDHQKLLNNVNRVRRRYSHSEGWRHLKKDGSIMFVNISGHGIEYNHRKAELVMTHDVTAEVKSREEVIMAKMNLDAMINNIKDLIWSVDRNYNILSANASFVKLTAAIYNRELTPGDSVLLSSLNPESAGQWKLFYDKVLGGESAIFNRFFPSLQTTFEIRMRPITHDNRIIGVVCLGRDIQQRLDAEKRMILQNNELREIASLASHEIRGPVTSLMGLANLFNTKNPGDPFNADLMDHIKATVKQLDSVIHKIVEKSYTIQADNEATFSSQQNLSDYE